MITLKACKTDNLNDIFNAQGSDTLCVFLPSDTVFLQKVTITRSNLIIVGTTSTTISWDDHNGMIPGFGTADSATITVKGNNVKFFNLTVENTFNYPYYKTNDIGNGMGLQAVAVYISPEATGVAFTNCTLLGYQDTLFADGKDCTFFCTTIKGCVDFIFGSSNALFSNCLIVSNGPGYVAAPSTKEGMSGFCFYSCTFTSENVYDGTVYLARPWHPGGRPGVCSEMSVINCNLSQHINGDYFTTMRDFKGIIHTPQESRFSIDSQSSNRGFLK